MNEQEAEQFFRENMVTRPIGEDRSHSEIYERFEAIGAFPTMVELAVSARGDKESSESIGIHEDDEYFMNKPRTIEHATLSRVPAVRKMAQLDDVKQHPSTFDGAYERYHRLKTAIKVYENGCPKQEGQDTCANCIHMGLKMSMCQVMDVTIGTDE